MANLSQDLQTAASIFIFLSAFPALWISGRVILRNFLGESRFVQLFLWFVLAGVVLIPLTDFVKYLLTIAEVILPSFQFLGQITNFEDSNLYSPASITLVIGVILYGIAIFYGRKIILSGKIPVINSFQLSSFEMGVILLGIAGIINYQVNRIVVNFAYLNVLISAGGNLGFLLNLLAGILILLVAFLIMNELLNRRENILSE
jgi:hypothetical protein